MQKLIDRSGTHGIDFRSYLRSQGISFSTFLAKLRPGIVTWKSPSGDMLVGVTAALERASARPATSNIPPADTMSRRQVATEGKVKQTRPVPITSSINWKKALPTQSNQGKPARSGPRKFSGTPAPASPNGKIAGARQVTVASGAGGIKAKVGRPAPKKKSKKGKRYPTSVAVAGFGAFDSSSASAANKPSKGPLKPKGWKRPALPSNVRDMLRKAALECGE
jgi:hypothetical protein